ncbi:MULTISPECIES: amino acid ABC transporter permease [Pectobacterium]|uniref:Amino acid ABC transporter permease n=1 Tax=Pectobacterium punjabense TaxID=2108399 RepID=A0ABX6L3W7_9GAMM|nr:MULTISPECIES: amino acid ABC transporter permease [Pectobacterium]GKW10646.1 ABC transporter permease [Pectobacterium carotovorum subsp. carotovorum]MBN3137992.1 amino acid ABC transporter permease [Pectobacterium punjabense]MBS4429283.1 amino acid ABC transporter permease [Pectobacterium punjabense]MBT9183778.1 amino acid ABC transporter permease [Pectobacterium punjabense]MCE5381999.1 amino acid ABC transporter permease [Pectobacterium punjabense]
MHYQWDFSLVWDNIPVLLKGLGVTLELWLLAGVMGTILGLTFGIFRVFGKCWLSLPARIFVEIFRNTPVLIQLIWFYYAFPVLVGIQFSTFAAAALALTLYSAAYCTEIFRAGLQSIDHGQWEGAKALGMRHTVVLRRVVLPQVLRNMLPALTNRMIELAKVTSLASILAVNELMYQGRLLSSTYYRPLEILTVVALLYFVLIWPGSYLAARLERRFRSTP